MPRNIPVETVLGHFYGRDCVYLDHLTFEDGTSTLVLDGSINGNLCTARQPGLFIPYSLRFHGVLALKMIELDSCGWDYESSFDEVQDSEWVRSLGRKVTGTHRHFFLQTYDDVFDVVCEGYEFVVHSVGTEPGSNVGIP
jgi:hypothetical protein